MAEEGVMDAAISDAAPSQDSEAEETLGADLFSSADDSDTPEEAQTEDGGHSENDFNPDSADWLRMSEEEWNGVPDQYKPLRGLAKNFQSMANRATEDAREAQRAAQQVQQQYQQYLQQMQQQQPQQTPQTQQQVDDLFNGLYFANEDERRGAEVVTELAKRVISPYEQKIQQLQQTVEQLQGGYQQWQSQQSQQQEQQWQAQIAEARGAYGDDINAYSNQIAALVSTPNPTTGQNYTVKQAYELVSGKAFQTSQELAAKQQAIRNGAQRRTSPASVGVSSDTSGRELTLNDARAEIGALPGFET